MRTTIRLNDQLLIRLKKHAAGRGVSMTAVIEEALMDMLGHRERPSERKPVRLITISGKGVQTGVNLNDSASLYDLMECRDASV